MNILRDSLCGMTSNMTRLSLRQRPAAGQQQQDAFTLAEAFSVRAGDGGTIGFVLSRLARHAMPLLWVQDRLSSKETGSPYLPGLRHATLIRVDVSRPGDVLWTMEEALRCNALSCVIGEIWGDPPALTFTATKRLAMRAEAHKVPCWLIRHAASPDLSAARDRWRITSLPSQPHPHDPQAPGAPRWQAELFRSRRQAPGTWVVSHDRATDRVHYAAPLRDGALGAGDAAAGQRAAR